jgi:hypothetical protein
MILIFRTPHLVEQLSLSILFAYFQQIGSIAESCSFETLLARFGAEPKMACRLATTGHSTH